MGHKGGGKKGKNGADVLCLGKFNLEIKVNRILSTLFLPLTWDMGKQYFATQVKK